MTPTLTYWLVCPAGPYALDVEHAARLHDSGASAVMLGTYAEARGVGEGMAAGANEQHTSPTPRQRGRKVSHASAEAAQ